MTPPRPRRLPAAPRLDLAALSDDKAVELGKPELGDHAAMYRREAAYLAGLSG
jgi:hypothetical protein